jgi:sulfonate transport system substrate-binding protein
LPTHRVGVLALAILAASATLSVYAGAQAPKSQTGLARQLKLAELPTRVPPGVKLVISDPQTQRVLEHTGWVRELPFQVQWADITTGPAVTEAFHAKVLDAGVAANMPPIHATWVGIPVKMIGVRTRQDPDNHPGFEIAISPKAKVRTLADLKGKRIAYSPGQVQGEIVLRTLQSQGLTPKDVTLVELPSPSADVYINALAGGLLDAAPIAAGAPTKRYLDHFGRDGAKVLHHRGFRDDLTTLYVRQETLADPGKAAALRAYVRLWGRAAAWINDHPDEWKQTWFIENQGLSPGDAAFAVRAAGKYELPTDWSEAIGRQQATVDLMGEVNHRPRFDAAILFDRRFEHVAANGAAEAGAKLVQR